MSSLQFAREPVAETALVQAAQWLTEPSEFASWVLIDAALVDTKRLFTALRLASWTAVNALGSSPLSVFGDQAPQLILLQDALTIQQGLKRVISIDKAAPAVSAFKSRASVAELQLVFAYLAQPRIDSDLQVHCRFADTRVLASLLSTLSPAQMRRVAGIIDAWQWFARGGHIERWSSEHAVESATETADTDQRLHLTSQQFANMLDASEADTIFTLLLDKTPELVPAERRGEFHARLQRQLEVATTLAVTQHPDRLQFIVLSLTCGLVFYRNAGLLPTWMAIRDQGASLVELMKSWSDELWNELQHSAETAT